MNGRTIAEAAEVTGYHPNHVRRLIRLGYIRAKKIGRVWCVDERSLTRYMSQREGITKPGPKSARDFFSDAA